jgi:polyisoprenoid-binding protein YceI
MSGKNIAIIAAILVVLGGGAYWYITRPLPPSSAPIVNAVTPPPAPSTNTDAETEQTPTAGASTYMITQEDSEVSFTLNEMLNGSPKVVVGTTDQVAGYVTFDPSNASAAMLSEIKVSARSLKTDSDNRNGAIGRFILKSDQAENEYITFTPSKIEGLPSEMKVGSSSNVSITGTLWIAGISRDATFTGTVKLDTADMLTASLSTVVKRGDFNLVIPNIPFVANVQEEVTLKANIMAMKEGTTHEE